MSDEMDTTAAPMADEEEVKAEGQTEETTEAPATEEHTA